MFRSVKEIINAYEIEEKGISGSWRIPLEPALSESLWHEALDYYENLGDEDECFWFKYYIAANETLPISVIERLSNDKHEKIRSRIAYRKDLTPDLLYKFSNDPNFKVQDTVSRNPLLPLELIIQLASSDNANVRYGACFNDNLPLEVLEKLMQDSDEDVKQNASENYKSRLSKLS